MRCQLSVEPACSSFLKFAAASFGLGKVAIAAPVGLVLLVLFVWMGSLVLRRWSASVVSRSALPWLMLGSYSITTAVFCHFWPAALRRGLRLPNAIHNVHYLSRRSHCLSDSDNTQLESISRRRYTRYFSLTKLAPILAVILLLAQLPNYFKEVRYANVLRLTLLQREGLPALRQRRARRVFYPLVSAEGSFKGSEPPNQGERA